MRIDYQQESGRKSTLLLPPVLAALGVAKFGSEKEFKAHARDLASKCPSDQKPTYWVRDALILEFSRPELIDKVGDNIRQHSLSL